MDRGELTGVDRGRPKWTVVGRSGQRLTKVDRVRRKWKEVGRSGQR